MLNNYAESGGGFSNNHGQTTRSTTEGQKQQNIGSTWGYNSQLEGMYYGTEPQPVYVGPYDGSTKHPNYTQYPSGTIHQPVPTSVVKCHEACCQQYHQDHRYPLNPAPLRYQPTGPIQPRYADLPSGDSRQYFTDRRSMQQSLSRKKAFAAENGYPSISERHFPQYMGRGQMHMADSRQQMQMMRSQYPMYPAYWGGARGWAGPRMNCPPPPPYHQSVGQGAQLQAGLKMADAPHYIDPATQKPISAQHRRGVATGGGGTEILRPVPEPKRSTLNPNLPNCYEFGYPAGFVPFSEVNKGGGIKSQNNSSNCKIPNDKQYHPHQIQYSMQSTDRNMLNCNSAINDLGYQMNFPMTGTESYLRSGLDDGQQISDSRKMPLQYDSLGKKRPDLDLRQYLATWEDDEDESTRLTEPLTLGNSGAPYIVVDCRSLEGEAAAKLQERFKTIPSQSSKSRSSSPNNNKRSEELPQHNESTERGNLQSEFQSQAPYAPAMPTLLNESEKNANFWNGSSREGEGVIGKGGAFQPLDCSKRDGNDPKRDSHLHGELPTQKLTSNNESANMSFDALVSFYGDNRRTVDGGYDFVEMTERLVNNSEKNSINNRTTLDQHPEITRPCDPRLQQSQLGNNPSIYNKVAPRYPTNNYQHFKPNMTVDPYYNYKHPMATSKYFGYENSQMVDPNYEYHKIMSEFDSARLFGNKEPPKDPRRMFHPELDKGLESAFIDPMRKTQIPDCFQDKTNLEFGSVDPDQFMTPIIMKKSDLDSRLDKNSAIRDRIDAINNENHPEKTVLITSQNGPTEIFRVPYSPDKELSNKDNVVTLHSSDQSKNNTITLEVPYVQQYSTLVKLSEEISRSEKGDSKSKNKSSEPNSTDKTTLEEFKKPTSFKLKRLPNSKEWTVADKNSSEIEKTISDSDISTHNSLPYEIGEERETVKSPVTVSNLNMPSLDDIRDGDDICESAQETHLNNVSESTGPVSDDNKNSQEQSSKLKTNVQTPQMAVVQPMKLNQSETQQHSESTCINSCDEGIKDNASESLLDPASPTNADQVCFESGKLPTEDSSQMELIPQNDISKHNNFRSHKKIQNFSNSIPNCLSSPNEEFLHPQDLNPGDGKEAYSPFHVYSDCDMNSQISDYFKLDERTSSDKMLDTRMPSSPGVEGMFEDINHSNPNQLYQSKSCNFQDLTDPNMVSISSHNTDFQSFSNIFSEDSDKSGRSDGSVLQMNDKKYLKEIFDDIENQQVLKSLEEQENDKIESHTTENNDMDVMSSTAKYSPPIPPISLKLNETKKIWCIAKKDGERCSELDDSVIDSVLKSTSPPEKTTSVEDDVEMVTSLTNLADRESEKSEYQDSISHLKEKEHNYCFDNQNKTILNKFIFNRVKGTRGQQHQSTNEVPAQTVVFSKSQCSDPQEKDFVQANTQNQCLSVVKYYPKIKILNMIKSSNNTNSRSETLVFDEKGTHFPKHCDTEKIEISDGKLIVQDIIENLITQSINNNNLSMEKIENVESVPFQNNYSNNREVCVETAVAGNVQSVIKYDNSSFLSLKDNGIAKTTEIFIQHEKENKHHSVIKIVPSEDNNCHLTETKMTVRSIFSPMSESDEEESSTLNVVQQANVQTEISIEANNSTDNDNNAVLDCSLNKTVISSMTDNVCGEGKSKNLYDGDEFRGFDSPNTNPCNSKQDICKQNNVEIDEALESMGLTSDTNVNEQQILNSKKDSEKCFISLQESLENNAEVPKFNDKLPSVSSPLKDCFSPANSNKCSTVQVPDVTEESKALVCVEDKFGNDISMSGILVATETLPGENEKSIVHGDNVQSEQLCPIKYNNNTKPLLEIKQNNLDKMNGNSALESSADTNNYLAQTNVISNLCDLKTHSPRYRKRTSSEYESIDAVMVTNSKVSKQITNVSDESSEIRCAKGFDYASQSEVEPKENSSTEDFEARLETSVIVRNNSNSSSVICKQSSETSINLYKPSYQPTHSSEISDSKSPNKVLTSDECCREDESNSSNVKEQHVVEDLVHNNNEGIISSDLQEETAVNHLEQSFAKTKNDIDTSMETVSSEVEYSLNSSQMQIEMLEDLSQTESSLKTPIQEQFQKSIPYCVSESVFWSCDDEVRDLLNSYSTSYINGFKKNKWEKYFKISKERHSLFYYDTDNHSRSDNFNQDSVDETNSILITNIDPRCSSINDCSSDYKNDKQTETCSYEVIKSKQVESGQNGQPLEENAHCSTVLNIYNSIGFCESSQSDHTTQFQKTLNQEQIKEKSEICKENETFSLRRDSFKIMEPEAILKEIFYPDTETDDFDHLESGNSENFPKSGKVASNSETNTFSIKDLSSDSERKTVGEEQEIVLPKSQNINKVSNLTDDDILDVLSQQSTKLLDDDESSDQNPCLPLAHTNQNVIVKHSAESTYPNKPAVTNVDCVQDLKQTNDNNKTISPDDTVNHVTTDIDCDFISNKSYLSNRPINLSNQHKTSTSIDDNSISSYDDTLIKRAVLWTESKSPSNSSQEQSKMMTSHGNLDTTDNSIVLESSIQSSDLLVESTNIEILAESKTENPLGQTLGIKDDLKTNIDTSNEKNVEDELCKISQQQNIFELPNKESEVIDDISIKRCSSIKKALQSDLDSHNIKIISKQDVDKENLNLTEITGENKSKESCKIIQRDILLSKEILQKGFNEVKDSDSHFNNTLKAFLKRDKKSYSDIQKRKVNSVQDSLKINQNLNQETFPLQCLVEAALALENVDSKEMLLNDSNLTEVYPQPSESCAKSQKIDEKKDGELSEKNSVINFKNIKINLEDKICNANVLTPADKEIFSKFEETNYNFRASTRIVTSSSSNIIPYPKRKYCFKSKLSSPSSENKQKKSETSPEKIRTKKRKGCFTYPRSKKRRKTIKDKQKSQEPNLMGKNEDSIDEPFLNNTDSVTTENLTGNNLQDMENDCLNNTYADTTKLHGEIEKEAEVPNKVEVIEQKILEHCSNEMNSLNIDPDNHLVKDSSQTDFGGPLLIANDKSTQRNIFCVHLNSNKMDDYVSNINLEDLEVLSENKQTSFKDNDADTSRTDLSNVTLENGTSLVIIIEDLDHSDKISFDESGKEESDTILGSIDSSCLQQSNSILDDCSDILNTEFSVNESCICPPDFELNSDNCDNSLLKDQPYEMLLNDTLIAKPDIEVSGGTEDDVGKYSVNCNEEMLITNCYEDMNTSLVSDIGNWPFVEEEVAEFDVDPELPNKIPEEGRKIELKCSLPWKKIFNMSKNKKKKSKTSKKVSGLELGPAKVEIRLKAPSAEWKVISDYHENSAPVVKVKRLILQRDSDVSSYSEKDSEEENEIKKHLLMSSIESDTNNQNVNIDEQSADRNMKGTENWQPVVRLTRNKELDELTLSLDSKLCSQASNCSENKSFQDFLESNTDSNTRACIDEKNEFENENYQSDASLTSCSDESSHSSQAFEHELAVLLENEVGYESSCHRRKASKTQVYETYSPSGDNALSGDNVYSPSDPHYSPEMRKDSESCSSCGEVRDECDDESDVFLDKNTLIIDQQTRNTHDECTTQDGNTLDVSDHKKDQLNEIIGEHNTVLETSSLCSKSVDFSTESLVEISNNSCYDSTDHVTKVSSPAKDTIFEEADIDISTDYTSKISPSSEELSSNPSGDVLKFTESSVKTITELRKNTRRKMPKNFFVRKKLRKVVDEEVGGSSLSPSENPSEISSLLQRLDSGNSSSSVESYQSDSQSRKSSLTNNSESDMSVSCEQSRLQCAQDEEEPLPARLNESPVVHRFEVKQRLRDGGRGIKRPCEGHSKEDTKRRRKKLRRHSSYKCPECNVRFQNKVELERHEVYVHPTRPRELHHCSLCHRSFSSVTRYRLHEQGRSHRHLELTQRHTVHAVHRLLVGTDCPRLPPLSVAELGAMQWRPAQPGYAHFYHDLTPLQITLQEHSSEASEKRLPND